MSGFYSFCYCIKITLLFTWWIQSQFVFLNPYMGFNTFLPNLRRCHYLQSGDKSLTFWSPGSIHFAFILIHVPHFKVICWVSSNVAFLFLTDLNSLILTSPLWLRLESCVEHELCTLVHIGCLQFNGQGIKRKLPGGISSETYGIGLRIAVCTYT